MNEPTHKHTAKHSPKPPKEQEKAETKKCPYCAEDVKAEAKKCKHCGEILDEGMRAEKEKETKLLHPKWSPGVAAVLSLFIPGAGQMYKGQIGNGLVWLVCTVLGYMFFILPGLVIHICCIVGAASGDPSK